LLVLLQEEQKSWDTWTHQKVSYCQISHNYAFGYMFHGKLWHDCFCEFTYSVQITTVENMFKRGILRHDSITEFLRHY
jgi:hypothetical protein